MTSVRALARLAFREVRRSPLRGLLIVTLIAGVVALGTVFAAIATETNPNDDVMSSAFGDSDVVVSFSTDDDARISTFFPGYTAPGSFSSKEREIRNTTFDLDAAMASAADQLRPPSGLRWARAFEDVGLSAESGPFGNFDALGATLDITNHNPIASGRMQLVQGRLPESVGEVAVDLSPRRGRLDPHVGSVVEHAGQTFTIVGTVTSYGFNSGPYDLVLAEDFDRLVAAEPTGDIDYFVFLDPGWQPSSPAEFVDLFATATGRQVTTHVRGDRVPDAGTDAPWNWFSYRDSSLDAPSDGPVSMAQVLSLLVTILLAVQVAFVSAAVFTVGVRRRAQQLALARVSGAGPRHVHQLLGLEGLMLGMAGVITGSILAVVLAGFVPQDAGFLQRLGPVRLSWYDFVGPAVIALIAVWAAAVWPARLVNSADTPALLSGRVPSPRPGLATSGRAVLLLLIGTGLFILVTRAPAESPTLIVAVALAVICIFVGAVLLIGPLLSIIGTRAHRLPLLARLVSRESDRSRSRSWIAIGSLMIMVIIPVIIGAGMKAEPGSGYQERELAFEGRLATFRAHDGFPEAGEADRVVGQQLATYAPIESEVELYVVTDAWIRNWPGGWIDPFAGTLIVATPELLGAVGADETLVAAIKQHQVVYVGEQVSVEAAGVADLWHPSSGAEQTLYTTPIELVPGPAWLNSTALISADHPAIVGLETARAGTARFLADPVSEEDAVAIRRAANAELSTTQAGQDVGRVSLRLNHPVNSFDSSGGALVAGTVGLAAAVSFVLALLLAALSAFELDKDLSTMVAAGAAPGLRRRFLGAQTLYHMVLAALLGVPLGVFLHWLGTRPDNPRFGVVVPWTVVGVVLVVIPCVVAAIVTLGFRGGRPSVSRRVT